MSTVNDTWNRLTTGSKEECESYFSNLDMLESKILECKGSVLTEPLYDRLLELNHDYIKYKLKELPHERPLQSRNFFHDNKFRALEAIAGMANNPGGGIVLFGVASQPKCGLSWKNLLRPDDTGMLTAPNMMQRYNQLAEGVVLGDNVLVCGIDHEMPNKKETDVSDWACDTYIRNLFSSSSGNSLFTGIDNCKTGEPPLWYCVSLYDFEADAIDKDGIVDKDGRTFLRDPEQYPPFPLARAVPWRRSRWCISFDGKEHIKDVQCRAVGTGEEERHFVAVLVHGCERKNTHPVYFNTYPGGTAVCGKKATHSSGRKVPCSLLKKERDEVLCVAVPLRATAGIEIAEYDSEAHLQLPISIAGHVSPEENVIQNGAEEDFFDESQIDHIDRLQRVYVPRPGVLAWIEEFVDQEYDPCLVLTGDPGGGKSALAAEIIRQREDSDRLVVYHFIKRSCKDRRSWRKITVSLLYQMYQIVSMDGGEIVSLMQGIFSGGGSEGEVQRVYDSQLRLINKSLRKQCRRLLVVIDALDELDNITPLVFLPQDDNYERIRFLVTSREGVLLERLKSRLDYTEIKKLHPMGLDDVSRLAPWHQQDDLSRSFLQLLHERTGGNPLYLNAVFRELRKNPDMDINALPPQVLGYYRREIERVLQKDEDGHIRRTLSLLLAAFRPLAAKELGALLEMTARVVSKDILLPLAPFLQSVEIDGSWFYGLLHDMVDSALTHGHTPLVDNDELDDAHRALINWSEPYLDNPSGADISAYARKNLAAHYWHLGAGEGYSGFQSLINQDTLQAELSCREFLRELIRRYSQDELLEDKCLTNILKSLYRNGSKAARWTLYRVTNDLNGFGYQAWWSTFWDDLFSEMIPGASQYDELFIAATVGRENKTRLGIALNRLAELDVSGRQKVDRLQLRSFLLVAGGYLCMRLRSGALYNPVQGLEYLSKARQVLDETGPDDFLSRAHGDIRYAKYLYLKMKGTFFNDIGHYHLSSGEHYVGLDFYKQSEMFHLEAEKIAPSPWLKLQAIRVVIISKSNIGATEMRSSNFSFALPRILEALGYRLDIGQREAAANNLVILTALFNSLGGKCVIQFLLVLLKIMTTQLTRESMIARFSTLFIFWHGLDKISEANQALVVLEKHLLDDGTPQAMFDLHRYRLLFAVLNCERKQTRLLIKECLHMLDDTEQQSTLINNPSLLYYTFWKSVMKGYLLVDEIKQAEEILTTKLIPWFERDQFFFTYLYPGFYRLQALVYRKKGDHVRAEQLEQDATALIEEGREQIRGIHFSSSLMQQIELLVEEYNNDELTSLFQDARDILATDLSRDH